MKYTIEGFNQGEAIKYGLNVEDLMILRWFVDFSPKMDKRQIEEKIYYWVKYQQILEDLPIMNFKSKDRLYRKMKKLTEKGILIHNEIRNKDGTFSYYGFGENYQALVKNNEPYVENTVPPTVKTTEHNNSSIKEINNICPSNDAQDSPTPIKSKGEQEKELADNFDKIWKLYPRKDGKNTAFTHYKSWLKGKKYAGRTIKLTNKQMWFATKKYADLMEENKTEKQFIKMGSTFFNEAIMEYVEVKQDE